MSDEHMVAKDMLVNALFDLVDELICGQPARSSFIFWRARGRREAR